jgi:voltage-gated potassium channel
MTLLPAGREQSLTRAQMLRVIALAIGRSVLVWVLLGVAYNALPLDDISGNHPVWLVSVILGVFFLAVGWSVVRISRSDMPRLRAAEALGATIPFFLTLFAVVYLVLDHQHPHSFSERLDHVSALYFTITVFATVGFGDITPITSQTRMVVSVQMLLNLVVIGVVAKLMIGAAQRGISAGKGVRRG